MGNFELARYTPFLDFTNLLECLTEARETLSFTGVLERNLQALGVVTQLAECLPGMHEVLGLIPSAT